MVESLVVKFDQAKYEEFLSSGSKSPKTRVCHRVSTGTGPETQSEALSGTAAKKGVTVNCANRNTRVNVFQETCVVSGVAAEKKVVAKHAKRDTRVNVSQETRVVKLSGVQPVHPCPQHQSSLVSLHLHDATETLSVDRGGVRVNCKLELLIVQLR